MYRLSCKSNHRLQEPKNITYAVFKSADLWPYNWNDPSIISSVKWSDPVYFLKSQGNFFLSFPCTLFSHIFDI